MAQGVEVRSNITGRCVDQKKEHRKDGEDIKVAGLTVCQSGQRLRHEYLTWLSLVAVGLPGDR